MRDRSRFRLSTRSPVFRDSAFFLPTIAARDLLQPGNLPQGNMNTTQRGRAERGTGRVAFTTEFFGGTDPSSAIYLADTSGPSLIALEDTPTHCACNYFRSFFSSLTTLNSAGQLAFVAELSDTANGPAAGKGLFFYDPTHGLQQIAQNRRYACRQHHHRHCF